ncbi:hypothetical protein [Brachybacterium sp. GPGPB12]|uniref:hypothetical protein n=1 Tax=Brachybacterium sp. GPGPB12 TaxID=3023517 RepID=UPI0031342FD2
MPVRAARRWETLVGFDTVLAVLDPDDPARSGHLPLQERLRRLRDLLDAGDERLVRASGPCRAISRAGPGCSSTC